jgi:drug/metabolite transporter (DMT)-like permease
MTLGVVLALASAFVWGSGDFCGGRAATRHDPFQVLGLAAVSGIAMLLAIAVATSETFQLDRSLWWACAAGVGGAGGIVALYRGLAIGSAATVAPAAAVMAAALPVLFGVLTEGPPRSIQLAGFALAMAGIFLVARAAQNAPGSRAGIRLGLLAGVGFGAFLILIAQVREGAVFVPLAIARAMMLATAVGVLRARGTPSPGFLSNPMALLAGVLDAGGNVLYLLAQQRVRLDIAAVLSSLYPVATVLLARVLLAEPVTRMQWFGAGVCLGAVVLIAA